MKFSDRKCFYNDLRRSVIHLTDNLVIRRTRTHHEIINQRKLEFNIL